MPRPSRPRSSSRVDDRVARLVWVAGRLSGVPFDKMPEWAAAELGVNVTRRRLQDAVAPVRDQSPHKRAPGRPGKAPLVRSAPLIRDALDVDEPALGLLRVLLRIANDGVPQPEVIDALKQLEGVRQVIEVDSTRELIVVALAASLEEADDLRARVEELVPGRGVRRDLISAESHAPAARTWRRLARTAARDAR